jgi:carbon monoxide dehydrogenase subunit G
MAAGRVPRYPRNERAPPFGREVTVLIENEFEVPAPLDRTWAYLLDVEKVAPCAPGAELTETVDERTWKGRVNVRLGPVALSFAGTVAIQERDDDRHRIVLSARGQETKGKGAASAAVTSWLEGRGSSTLVKMEADISLTGTVAQMSRGLLPDVSKRLTAQFADCLRDSIGAERPAPVETAGSSDPASGGAPGAVTPSAPARAPSGRPASSIGGVRLGLWAIWQAIARALRRLFGRS